MIQHIENIKQHYSEILPRIMSRDKGQWVAPYTDLVDWNLLFSPIEEQTWMALRSFGKCPLYPQYPIDRFFVDFGNPKFKVAIECDGKEWHQDKEKDAKRDMILLEQGWHIFRISGADCFRLTDNYHDRFEDQKSDDEVCDILKSYYCTIEGLIKAISFFYFDFKDYSIFDNESEIAFDCLRKYVSPIQYNSVINDLAKRLVNIRAEYYEFMADKDYKY